MTSSFAHTHNSGTLNVKDVPILDMADFQDQIIDSVANGAHIATLSAYPVPNGKINILAALTDRNSGRISVASAHADKEYPALTLECEQAHMFEREIYEQYGIRPIGHPWLKPARFQPPARAPKNTLQCGITNYFKVEGDEIHEVAVGPVHAGIIEPGHFRFQCHGETVYHLEISLGYQHRGVERHLVGGPDKRTIHYMETLSGDTTIGHSTAYCQTVEALTACTAPLRAQVIRGIALELERLANHIGDLGALAGDVGFLPTQSFCGRIRGDALNMTAVLCGNRFGRGLLIPGGTGFDLAQNEIDDLLNRLDALERDSSSAIKLLWETPSVLARFEQTGTISLETCRKIGLAGVAARACGEPMDIRNDFPNGVFQFSHIPVSTCSTGDVFARAYVRWMEIQRSIIFIREQLTSLPSTPHRQPSFHEKLLPNHLSITLVEGWRGEICHTATTDNTGKLAWYKIVDPSFHNWFGVACAMRNQEISDFPLCNKSFNLSYCGHDL